MGKDKKLTTENNNEIGIAAENMEAIENKITVEEKEQEKTEIKTEPTPIVPEKKETQSDNYSDSTYSPFMDEPVNEKEYAKPIILGSTENIPDLPEVNVSRPTVSFDTNEIGVSADDDEPIAKEPVKPLNPAMADMTTKEKEKSSEYGVDTLFDFYDKLHALGRNYAKISEKKLKKLHDADEIDMRMELPIDKEQSEFASLEVFVKDNNEQIDETIILDPEFVEKARPVAIEVFAGLGWGLTPAQRLGYMFLEDVAGKASLIYSCNRNSKELLESFKEFYKYAKSEKTKINDELNSDK